MLTTALNPELVDKHVGLKIRARRKVLGVSQSALADALGLTFQQVQKYERGANRVSASKLFQIAAHLRCDISHFFEGLDPLEMDHAVADPIVAFGALDIGGELAQLVNTMPPRVRRALLAVAYAMTDGQAEGGEGAQQPIRRAA